MARHDAGAASGAVPDAALHPGYFRLRGCPRCGSRWRTLTESAHGGLDGRCLHCGSALSEPLGVETQGRVVSVR